MKHRRVRLPFLLLPPPAPCLPGWLSEGRAEQSRGVWVSVSAKARSHDDERLGMLDDSPLQASGRKAPPAAAVYQCVPNRGRLSVCKQSCKAPWLFFCSLNSLHPSFLEASVRTRDRVYCAVSILCYHFIRRQMGALCCFPHRSRRCQHESAEFGSSLVVDGRIVFPA